MHRDVVYAQRAIEAGAAGFVLKHSASKELVHAVREAAQGRQYVTSVLAEEVLHAMTQHTSEM
jgi:DNA-binding NarL/FixJ family response regulator